MFDNLLIVVAVAFAAPLLLGLAPRLRLPAVVLEIGAGIALGPDALGLVEVDATLEVVALLGLAFLLFLAGLEVDLDRLRGRALRITALGFALSIALGLAAGALLDTSAALLIAIALSATSLGVVVPVLKDAGEVGSPFGQLVIAGASVADFGAIILLSVFFSEEGGAGATLLLVGLLAALAGAVLFGVRGAEHSVRLRTALTRLQDTTAQIRVRGAFLLLVAFAAIATQLGLEVILGAFLAGAILTLVDRDEAMTHPQLRAKLEAVGFGVFIPVFFVTSGVRFDLDALLGNLVMVPLCLAALLVVRGVPVLLYRLDARRTVAAALLQATSLPFLVTATTIGTEMGLLDGAQAAALVGAGLLSVLLFPLLALAALRGAPRAMMTV
ncbi:cation:proton antiporter [Solirubrobacter taibaiensis]|nr:cation:proton antiporter [Solirubrobacter taibaiensis]